jgi:hypothetical protein
MVDCFEHSNKTSSFVKGGEFPEEENDSLLPKKDPTAGITLTAA